MNTERQGAGGVEVGKEGIASEVSDGLDDDVETKVDDEELLCATECSSWRGTNGAADALKWAGDGYPSGDG